MSPSPSLSPSPDCRESWTNGLPEPDEFRALSGHRRDEAYMGVEREIRRLHALQAMMVAEVRESCSFVDDAHHSAAAWLRAVTNSSKRTAAEMVRISAMTSELALVGAAAADGSVGPDQLRLLMQLHANDRCRPKLPASEALLVGHAQTLTLRDFRLVCQRWEAHADPDGRHRDHEASRESRHVRSARIGAGQVFHAEGDGFTMDIINEILNRHADAEFEVDLAERFARFGEDAAKHPLARNARQRLYDAMLAIYLKAASTTDSTTQVPLVNIFCTEAVLNDAIREFVGLRPDRSGTPASERLRMCETASGSPVDPFDLVVAALIGQVRRVVVDSAGRVIDLGRRSRLFTGAAREAILLCGDRCNHPGCGRRTGRIQIDHLDAWVARSGSTNPFNGGPMCPTHNRAKERGRFTVKLDERGWHHYRPDGSEIAPRSR